MRAAAECAAPARAFDASAQYHAAHTAVVIADRSDLGRVRFEGKDAADLLHRLSTNAVKDLPEGSGVATVFTTAKGRILDLVTLHRTGGALLGFCAAARVAPLREWVDRYTFREAVTTVDWTASHRTLALHGPRAAAVVGRCFGAAAAALPLHGVTAVAIGTLPAIVVRTFPLAGDGFLLTVPVVSTGDLRRAIDDGAGETVVEADASVVEVLRVESGLPASSGELTEEHNPWEARLDDAISLSKGCYVGQEVVARLNTYQKVVRRLVRLAIPAADATTMGRSTPGAPVRVAPGDPIRVGAGAVGVVTSSVVIPDGSGRTLALGYVRSEQTGAGTAIEVDHAGAAVPGVVEGVAR